ncbi:phytanoyl-CoA dioxygenase family protein [Allorhizocola rhizosphaerae]|uniref:phytanoyl-CoA dioxygenase family protein n=1 Tax=Allorhizocola rhizosphaerae TaxID=1872709 RepID=UPI001B8C9129|nr:phytanoyl-CoA dioxygenase family protein [Allorhizocola rhizosphaerae]
MMSHSYNELGYAVARRVFPEDEVARLREHYMTLRRRGSYEKDLVGVDASSRDPLKRYPRMAQMHRWDDTSLRWLIDARIRALLNDLLGGDPYAVQTMLYFKPAGARGQALHQDNFYLKAQPGNCVAAWMALDRADEDNGCMLVVPGSHTWPILCTVKADTTVSFTDVTVPVPTAYEVVPVVMEPGDVLFFNGSLVHGSLPNQTADRFRRALIGHYIQAEAKQVGAYYHPALRMDGTPLELDVAEGGGACGEWASDVDGQPVVTMTGTHTVMRKHE